jgi:hypothetical protein
MGRLDNRFEFDALESLMRAYGGVGGQALPIGQLQVEIHLNEHVEGLASFLQWWEGLEKGGLRPVWTEPNLLQVTLRIADAMPRFAEVGCCCCCCSFSVPFSSFASSAVLLLSCFWKMW